MRPGEAIGERYVVERVLGKGGVGVVVAARHRILGQRVAIKFLRDDHAREPETVQRLLREARALAQLRGVHVARVMDCGTLETGEPFFVMEYIEGTDLEQILRREGPLPIDLAVEVLLQACEGIAEAHALGIVHRDLKPGNLLVTRSLDGSPLVKVLDFGLSKLEEPAAAELTQSLQTLGSPHYMSPEQLRASRRVDHRSDIWSLGNVLYACLTGKPPFDGLALGEVCAAILGGPYPSLRARRRGAPPDLEAIVSRCVRADAAERFQTVAELVSALAPFGGPDAPARVERIRRVLARGDGRLAASYQGPSPQRRVFEPAKTPVLATCARGMLGAMRTLYESLGGFDALFAVCRKWHQLCLADSLAAHPFKHARHPHHEERLAAYLAEVTGGPRLYTAGYGDETSMQRLHAGNGEHRALDERCIALFEQALEEVGIPAGPSAQLAAHFRQATEAQREYAESAHHVPEGLPLPAWR